MPSKEVRSLLFYTQGAGPQRGGLVCPKSPWSCVRACVGLWPSFSGPLSLLLGCLPQGLQCPQRLWCQEMLWMPFSWGGPLAWRERNSGWELTSQDCLPGGEQVEEFTRPKQGSCWLQIILFSLIKSGTRLWSEPALQPQYVCVCVCVYPRMHACMLSCVWLVTQWTVVLQTPLSMEFSSQEYWSGFPFLIPGDLPNLGIEPGSPVLQVNSLPSEPRGSPSATIDSHLPSGDRRLEYRIWIKRGKQAWF